MPLVNRDKDASEQREVYTTTVMYTLSGASAGIVNPGVSTANTFPLFTVPYPATIVTAGEAAYGLSGTPVHSLWIYRFAGGFTSIVCGQTMNVTAYGTSGGMFGGTLGYSLVAGVAATFPLQSGDQVVLYTQGANTATASSTVTVVVKALQDIKSHFSQ